MPTTPHRLYLGTSVLDDTSGGWAAVIEGEAIRRTLTGREPSASVDDLGLRALIAALAALPAATPVRVVTANQRLRDGLAGQLATWARNGWRTGAGRELRNRPLWEQVHALTADRSLAGAAAPLPAELPLANRARRLAARAATQRGRCAA
jgi:ribonuclease HI